LTAQSNARWKNLPDSELRLLKINTKRNGTRQELLKSLLATEKKRRKQLVNQRSQAESNGLESNGITKKIRRREE
jgi:hypothetical protein